MPTFVGVTLLTFALLHLAPGDPGSLLQPGEGARAHEAVRAWERSQELDRPLVSQYLTWLSRSLTLDFGRSYVDTRPVRERLFEALPPTLLVAGSALLLTYLLAIPLGIHAAVRRGSFGERVISGASFVLYALPPFWVALLSIVLFAGGEALELFPLRGLASPGAEHASWLGRGLDLAWHLCLPVFCIAYPALARTTRLVRSSMLEALGQDWVRAARARGLPERRVLWSYAAPAALVPVIAHLSVDVPLVLGGSVIVERIFTIPGMGMLLFEAILRRDYPVIMGATALAALVSMAALLVGDLVHLWLDPRSRAAVRS